MIARLLCSLPKWLGGGHKRGKRLASHETGIKPGFNKYLCPRCSATWDRKAKAA